MRLTMGTQNGIVSDVTTYTPSSVGKSHGADHSDNSDIGRARRKFAEDFGHVTRVMYPSLWSAV